MLTVTKETEESRKIFELLTSFKFSFVESYVNVSRMKKIQELVWEKSFEMSIKWKIENLEFFITSFDVKQNQNIINQILLSGYFMTF